MLPYNIFNKTPVLFQYSTVQQTGKHNKNRNLLPTFLVNLWYLKMQFTFLRLGGADVYFTVFAAHCFVLCWPMRRLRESVWFCLVRLSKRSTTFPYIIATRTVIPAINITSGT